MSVLSASSETISELKPNARDDAAKFHKEWVKAARSFAHSLPADSRHPRRDDIRTEAAIVPTRVIPESQPIGLGKPLSVEVAHIYTGMLSSGTTFNRRPDLLLAASIKRVPVFEAAPRAILALVPDVARNTNLPSLPATVPGTPLLFYSPALTDRGVSITVEMIFDSFPEKAFNDFGQLLSSSAGIPIFAPASGYLLAGALIVKLVGAVAERTIDGKPKFSANIDINLERPLRENSSAGVLLVTQSPSLRAAFDAGEWRAEIGKGLVNVNGIPYSGPEAYLIVTLDGTERPDYKDFTPTMASAALLDRFLHTGEDRPTSTGLLLEAATAYNDIIFRSRAEESRRNLTKLQPDSEQYKKEKNLLEAYLKNIKNDSLKTGF